MRKLLGVLYSGLHHVAWDSDLNVDADKRWSDQSD
jgi:hypothetical protein